MLKSMWQPKIVFFPGLSLLKVTEEGGVEIGDAAQQSYARGDVCLSGPGNKPQYDS